MRRCRPCACVDDVGASPHTGRASLGQCSSTALEAPALSSPRDRCIHKAGVIMRRRITCLDLIMLLLSALASCALLACSTSYDAQTDAMLMQLHGKTVAFLLHIFYTG